MTILKEDVMKSAYNGVYKHKTAYLKPPRNKPSGRLMDYLGILTLFVARSLALFIRLPLSLLPPIFLFLPALLLLS